MYLARPFVDATQLAPTPFSALDGALDLQGAHFALFASGVLFDAVASAAGNAFGTYCAVDAAHRVLCRGECKDGQCGVSKGVRETKLPLRVPLTR